MSANLLVNDAILHRFLTAEDFIQSQAELMTLVSQNAEPCIKSIIIARLRNYFKHERHPDYEDLVSETKTRLLAYLEDLKADGAAAPCKDFRNYVAGIAHTACHDYFRQRYPARARLHKKIRDHLSANPQFAIWREQREFDTDWMCGFDCWRDQTRPSNSSIRGHRLDLSFADWIEVLASGTDTQVMALDDLLTSIFRIAGEPIKVADAVEIIAGLKGIKDLPSVSFDTDESTPKLVLSDSRLRIDSVLEMREPLWAVWSALSGLRRDCFKAYLLHARDDSGEDLISLFIAAKIVTEQQIADLFAMSLEQFRDLRQNHLPLDNESISRELGVSLPKVYKLRCQAVKQLRVSLSETGRKKVIGTREKSAVSPS